MGCDIHLYVERRDEDGVWRSLDTWHDDPDEPGQKSVYLWGPGIKRLSGPVYDDRNYALFSILADVRNGYGFAGCDTGSGFVPIVPPRGVPSNASPEYTAEVKRWGRDGHSHSWLTLGEILRFDWTQVTQRRGWVNPIEWAKWRDLGKPNAWSGAVYGGRVTHHTPEEFEAAWQRVRANRGYPEARNASAHLSTNDSDAADLAMFVEPLGGSPYTKVAWETSYHDACASFWSDCVPKLLALSDGRFEDLRVVFFFDN